MSYNAIDLIDKAINISRRLVLLCEKEVDEGYEEFNLIGNIFIKHRLKRIDYYNLLKEKLKNQNMNSIDIHTYDKVYSLMCEFENKINLNLSGDLNEFIEWVLELNLNARALFIDIRGRLSKNLNALEYDILTSVIDIEEKYINDLKLILSKANSNNLF